MTEQEAIIELQKNIDLPFGFTVSDEASETAIKALEKQVPKKVVPRHIRKYDGFDDGECPTCGNSVLRDGFSNDVYCDDCGQKLDWEGGE